MNTLSILFLVIFSLSGCVTTPQRDEKFEEKPIVLSLENLANLKASPEAMSLRKIFKAAELHKRQCPQCREFFPESNRYQSFFKNPFLTVHSEPNDFGGAFLLIVFSGKPKVYRLWVYEIDHSEFQVREMAPLPITLSKELMDELTDSAYSPYWM